LNLTLVSVTLVLTHHADAKGAETAEGHLPALKEKAKKGGATKKGGSSLDGPKKGSSEMDRLEEGGGDQDDVSDPVEADPVPVSVARVDDSRSFVCVCGMCDVYVQVCVVCLSVHLVASH